jgi:hypothetical protein
MMVLAYSIPALKDKAYYLSLPGMDISVCRSILVYIYCYYLLLLFIITTILHSYSPPAVFIIVLGFEIGPGPVFFVIAAELYPKESREAAISVIITIYLIFNILVVLIYLPLVEGMGERNVFIMLSVFSALITLFCIFFVPETKGKEFTSLEDKNEEKKEEEEEKKEKEEEEKKEKEEEEKKGENNGEEKKFEQDQDGDNTERQVNVYLENEKKVDNDPGNGGDVVDAKNETDVNNDNEEKTGVGISDYESC